MGIWICENCGYRIKFPDELSYEEIEEIGGKENCCERVGIRGSPQYRLSPEQDIVWDKDYTLTEALEVLKGEL